MITASGAGPVNVLLDPGLASWPGGRLGGPTIGGPSAPDHPDPGGSGATVTWRFCGWSWCYRGSA